MVCGLCTQGSRQPLSIFFVLRIVLVRSLVLLKKEKNQKEIIAVL